MKINIGKIHAIGTMGYFRNKLSLSYWKGCLCNYLKPKGLLLPSSIEKTGYQQYRWLCFYLCVKQ